MQFIIRCESDSDAGENSCLYINHIGMHEMNIFWVDLVYNKCHLFTKKKVGVESVII